VTTFISHRGAFFFKGCNQNDAELKLHIRIEMGFDSGDEKRFRPIGKKEISR
jgi:hypothetical protein